MSKRTNTLPVRRFAGLIPSGAYVTAPTPITFVHPAVLKKKVNPVLEKPVRERKISGATRKTNVKKRIKEYEHFSEVDPSIARDLRHAKEVNKESTFKKTIPKIAKEKKVSQNHVKKIKKRNHI